MFPRSVRPIVTGVLLSGLACGCASTSKQTAAGVTMIVAGFAAIGAGTVMSVAGSESRPIPLVLYPPGQERPDFDRTENPALAASGIALFSAGLISSLVGAALVANDESLTPVPREPLIESALRRAPTPKVSSPVSLETGSPSGVTR